MESETNPNTILKPPPLNSDQLNYLIWRYLQEAGYGEAAVKLQRDWKVEPENLPFANLIKGQALVSLVQKGLRYHHLSLTIDENGRTSKTLNPSTFFFGADSARSVSSDSGKEPLYRSTEVPRASSPATNISSTSKKRESDFNESLDPLAVSTKRSRKATTTDRNGNSARKTSTAASDAPTAMDLDHPNGSVDNHRSMRSPSFGDHMHDENAVNGTSLDTRMDVDMEALTLGMMDSVSNDPQEGMPPIVHTLTNGESVGIQVAPAKVANLGPSTNILSLPEKSYVTKGIWQPADGSSLTVAGDHFCGAWRNMNSNLQDDTNKMVYQELVGFNDTTMITAVDWAPNGGLLAIATYSDQAGQLRLFEGRELTLIENLPASQRAITSLKWLPSTSTIKLVGIAPYDDQGLDHTSSSTILVWDFSEMKLSASPLPLTVPELLLDVDSIQHGGHGVICAAGGNAVYHFRANKELVVQQKWISTTTEKVNWAFVRCASSGDINPAIIVASADSPCIWLPDQDILQVDAHTAPITGLELRSRSFSTTWPTAVPDFATSSMDGTIKIWRYSPQSRVIEAVHRLSIDQGFPIMSLSFSPDGFCLAGASYGSTRIWNSEHGYNLMASWEAKNEEWRGIHLRDEDVLSAGGSSSMNGDNGTISVDHALAWDEDSKKLAFGLTSQVAIINFQR